MGEIWMENGCEELVGSFEYDYEKIWKIGKNLTKGKSLVTNC